jgi:hypothetical protein
MLSEVPTNCEQGDVPSLVKGIVSDFRDLIVQQFQFARTEIRTDLRKTGKASLLLITGVATACLGVVILTLTLVHLLHWLTLPAGAEPAGLPLWASYGIIAGLILGTGAALILAGKAKFDSFNPLPHQTAETIKENLEWKTNSK